MDCSSLFGLSTVIEALGTNTSVKELHVVFPNRHDEARHSEGGGRRLIDLLPRTKHLETLHLEHLNDDRWGEGVQADVLHALKLDTSLTKVEIDWLGDSPDVQLTIKYYTTRNRLAPQLASASMADMSMIFEFALLNHGNAGWSVVF